MKKIGTILSILLAFACTTGCQTSKPEETTTSMLPVVETSPISQEEVNTKDDIINIFSGEEANKYFTVTDCVVVDDSAYGLIGVVQYTDKENNQCNLGFVKEEKWSYPIGIASDGSFAIADDSKLTYLGDGKVELSLVEIKTGKIIDYVVEYSVENENTYFEVSSNERK